MPKIDETEEFLKRFSLQPPPAGLRKKVLLAAAKRRGDERAWSPLRWKAALALFVLGFSIVLADAALNQIQDSRLAGLLGGPPLGRQNENSRQELVAEVLGGLADTAWLDWRMKIREKTGAQIRRDLFRYLKEELDGS